ncbi:MAG: hypothetical protein COA33_013885 [Fluviicola sp.]|nr:hypothetical protein [Fluviicola sp.]
MILDINNPLPFLLFNGLIWVTLIGLIIYFITKRIKDKKKETFEDRDN